MSDPLIANPLVDRAETLAALARMLDFAASPGRFALAFAQSNLPLQRRQLVEQLKEILAPLSVAPIEIELKDPIDQLLPILRDRLADSALALGRQGSADQPKPAIFVYGLEQSIPSTDPNPPLLAHLNLSRELYRHDVPCPVVLWLPDYALTLLARNAPDFWAWRSGVYEFPAVGDLARGLVQPDVQTDEPHQTSNLSAQTKRTRLSALAQLLEDYQELGAGLRERAAQVDVLNGIGDLLYDLGERVEARQRYEQALALARASGKSKAVAVLLNNLATLAREKGEFAQAQQQYAESLELGRQLADNEIITHVLGNIGLLAYLQGDFSQARLHFQNVLALANSMADKAGAVKAFNQLASLAHTTGDLVEASRLYQQGFQLAEATGNKSDMALTLSYLAALARAEGNLDEAGQLFEQSLQIAYALGDRRQAAINLHEMGRLAQSIGDLAVARQRYAESLALKRSLGDKYGSALTLAQTALLEEQRGEATAALPLIQQAELLFTEMDSQMKEKAKRDRERIESEIQRS